MEVDQGAPLGKEPFGSASWREMFKFVCREAARLGLEVNMNNDAGWCGSGGPWIKPEQSMQKLVWTEATAQGGKPVELQLGQPKAVRNYYEDIAVLAFPTPRGPAWRIGDQKEIDAKAAFRLANDQPTRIRWPEAPDGTAIPKDKILDISEKMDKNGKLVWNAPAGRLDHHAPGPYDNRQGQPPRPQSAAAAWSATS